MTKYMLSTKKCLVLKYCFMFIVFKGSTPLHDAASKGHKEVVELLLSAGASLSVVNKEVIKTSVKLRLSNIKPFKWCVILLLKQKMLTFMTYQKKTIWWQPLTVWTDWIVTRNGGNIRRLMWPVLLFVWSNWISKCWFY